MRELPDGRLEVLTYKEGLLSRVAHDLLLVMDRFIVQTDGQRVEARFFPDSLRVVGAMRDGELDRSALSPRDQAEIRENIRAKILHTDRHPEARFEGTRRDQTLVGTLELNGERGDLEIDVREHAGKWVAEVEFQPSKFGIAPFKALLGAIKLRDRVRIRFEATMIESPTLNP